MPPSMHILRMPRGGDPWIRLPAGDEVRVVKIDSGCGSRRAAMPCGKGGMERLTADCATNRDTRASWSYRWAGLTTLPFVMRRVTTDAAFAMQVRGGATPA